MDDDLRSGQAAAVRLMRGVPLSEALDTGDARAWTALDLGVRQVMRYGVAQGVRARVVAGLRTLDVADAARLSPLLDDPAPGVVRETATALLPSAGTLPEEALLARLGAGRPRHVRVAAFRLLDARCGPPSLCWTTRTPSCAPGRASRCSGGVRERAPGAATRRSAPCWTGHGTFSAATP